MLEIETQDPYSMFLFAMRSPKTRKKCTGRLRMFFDFLGIAPIKGTMTERSKVFCEKAKNDSSWVFSAIIQYLQQLKERVERKEITCWNYEESLSICQIILRDD